jgi:hypothetical protein
VSKDDSVLYFYQALLITLTLSFKREDAIRTPFSASTKQRVVRKAILSDAKGHCGYFPWAAIRYHL